MKSRMKRISTLGAAALLSAATLATPAMAAATSHSRALAAKATGTTGVIIAKNVRRHTIVVTSASGTARTIRLTPRALAKARVGEGVTSRTKRLADGTYSASTLVFTGTAVKARVRGTVVMSHAGKMLLSAGGSVFAISTGRTAHSQSPTSSSTGEEVNVTVAISQSSLDLTSEQSTGQANLIGLDGVLTAVSATSLTIMVEDGANTMVAVPSSLTLPSTIVVGDNVEVVVDYANQAFTLVTIKDDSLASNNQGQGVSEGDGQSLQAEGQVVAVSATSLTVQPGEGAAAVTFSVPSTLDVSTLVVGDLVDAEGLVVSGVLTLSHFEAQQGDNQGSGDQASTEITGVVTALSATSVTVTSFDSSVSLTAAIPTTLDVSGLVLGLSAHLTADFIAGVLTATKIEVS